MSITYQIETEQENDGRWIAEVVDLPGVLTYGRTEDEAIRFVQAIALHVIADKLETERSLVRELSISFRV